MPGADALSSFYPADDSFQPKYRHEKDDFVIYDLESTTVPAEDDDDRSEPVVRIREWKCTDSASLSAALEAPEESRHVRIVSIHTQSTFQRLHISEDSLARLSDFYRIEPEFQQCLDTFAGEPRDSEAGTTNVFTKIKLGRGVNSALTEDDQVRVCGYTLQYVEPHGHQPLVGNSAITKRTPWAIRHSAVYHQSRHVKRSSRDGGRETHLFIVVHGNLNSRFRETIKAICLDKTKDGRPNKDAVKLCADPCLLHGHLFETYLDNWRSYLRYYGEGFADSNDDIFTLDIQDPRFHWLEFNYVRRLRNNRDVMIPIGAICHGNQTVLTTVKLFHASTGLAVIVDTYLERVRGFSTGVEILLKRMENSIDLLQYALDSKNHLNDSEMNRHIVELTHHTVDDSATVKIITILGGIFLPGTFISGLFGMNFFDYNGDQLVAGTNVWLFFAIWLPLTAITMLVYAWMTWRRKLAEQDRKEQQHRKTAAMATATAPAFATKSLPRSPTAQGDGFTTAIFNNNNNMSHTHSHDNGATTNASATAAILPFSQRQRTKTAASTTTIPTAPATRAAATTTTKVTTPNFLKRTSQQIQHTLEQPLRFSSSRRRAAAAAANRDRADQDKEKDGGSLA